MTDTEEETTVYMILVKASNPDDTPNDLVKLTTEIKNLQTEVKNLQSALYYTASIIRELDASTLIRREEE